MAVVEFYCSEKLTEAMWKFLRRLNSGLDAGVQLTELENRARQKARKQGYATYTRVGKDRGWKITPTGVQALLSVDTAR